MAEHSLTSRKENGDPDHLFTLPGAASVNQGVRFNGHIEKKAVGADDYSSAGSIFIWDRRPSPRTERTALTVVTRQMNSSEIEEDGRIPSVLRHPRSSVLVI